MVSVWLIIDDEGSGKGKGKGQGGEERFTGTVIRHKAQTPKASDVIRFVQQDGIRHQDTSTRELDLDVQIMVRHIQHLARHAIVDTRRPVDGAGKRAVRRREGGFPHVAELVEDVGNSGLIGFVIHEDDGALAGQDKLRQSGPVVGGEPGFGGDVGVFAQAAVFDGMGVVAYVDEVAVADEDCDDVVGVGADPGRHVAEVGFDGAGVEEGAGGVAVVKGVILHVRLALYCVVREG